MVGSFHHFFSDFCSDALQHIQNLGPLVFSTLLSSFLRQVLSNLGEKVKYYFLDIMRLSDAGRGKGASSSVRVTRHTGNQQIRVLADVALELGMGVPWTYHYSRAPDSLSIK